MGLNIKNPKVERLAKQLATETGQSITGAIEKALEGITSLEEVLRVVV